MTRAVGPAVRRWRDRNRPLLSVVVPVYNGESHLDACLRSLVRQDYRHVEVVVVDDGSTDSSLAIAQGWATRDRRIRTISQPNTGVAGARSKGVDEATGEFLTFVDADDTVTRTGLRSGMSSIEESGSDVAVMPYQRLVGETTHPSAPWIRALKARPARATTLAERPDVLVHSMTSAKIYRRAFWDEIGLEFADVLLAGDQVVSTRAYVAARSIDITSDTSLNWRRQDSSISQGQVTAAAVHAWSDSAETVFELLAPLPEVRAERAIQLLTQGFANLMLKLERAEDAYLDALIERLPAIVAVAPADRYAREVPAQYRVAHTLIANGDRDAVWGFVRAEGLQAEMHPSGQEPAGLTVYLPGWQHDPVPPEAYVLTADQTALKVKVRHARTVGADLVLDVAAWFPNLELAAPSLTVAAAQVEHCGEPAVFTSRQGSERAYPGSGWTVTLPGGARRAPDQIELTLEDSGRSQSTSARVPRPVA